MAEYSPARQKPSASLLAETIAEWFLIAIPPLFILVTLIAILISSRFETLPSGGNLNFERVAFEPGRIVVSVLNSGRGELTIAQAIVNDAVWDFTSMPSAILQRNGHATILLRYPWMEGEAQEIKFISTDGSIYSRAIASATESAPTNLEKFATLVLFGSFAGLVPIVIGFLWTALVRKIGTRGKNILLSFAIGLLFFLGAEALSRAMEIAGRVAKPFQGAGLMALGAVIGFFVVTMFERFLRARTRNDAAQGLRLAYAIAFALGVRNFGASLTFDASTMGVMITMVYFLQHLAQGLAIVTPITRAHSMLKHFVPLGLIAGGPMIAGLFIGGFANSEFWTTLILALGVGATVRVIFEIAQRLKRDANTSILDSTSAAGVLMGLGVMVLPSLLF